MTAKPTAFDDVPATAKLSRQAFHRLASFITAELGIKMPESKISMVQSRLLRRVRELGLASVEHYCDYFFLSSSQAEREQFINAITTNKTDFFREPSHFDFLTRVALPALAGRSTRFPQSHVRAWSAGCSSGEEPYTLAMVLSEYARLNGGFDYSIVATDVSTRVLERGRNGIYHESQVAVVPPELRRQYLWRSRNPSEDLVRVAPDLRRRVVFRFLNLMDERYGMTDVFDVVFFRNVMIYFDRPTQEAIVNKISSHLAPGGYFFVGHSESLAGLDIPVTLVAASVFRKPLSGYEG